MKASELREKSLDELKVDLVTTLEKQFRLRMQAASGEKVQSHLFKEARRGVARIKTILTEKAGN